MTRVGLLLGLVALAGCPPPDDCQERPQSPSELQDRYFACMLGLEQTAHPDTDGELWEEHCLRVARCR